MFSSHRYDNWIRTLQYIKLNRFSIKPYGRPYSFTTIINCLALLMELASLYTGVGYGIVKLYSLYSLYSTLHIRAARAHALSNMHYAKFYERNNYPDIGRLSIK